MVFGRGRWYNVFFLVFFWDLGFGKCYVVFMEGMSGFENEGEAMYGVSFLG